MIHNIYILQSLEKTDPKTGELLSKALTGKIINEFTAIRNRDGLFIRLNEIISECTILNGYFVLHFDCHGNEDGIGLYDENNHQEFVEWEELRQAFRKMYELTHIKPLISLSCCKGFSAVKLLTRFEPCPFKEIAGSLIDVPFGDSVNGFYMLYQLLQSGMSLVEAGARVHSDYPKLKFIAYPADHLFELGWVAYKESQLIDSKLKERKSNILAGIEKGQGFPPTVIQIDLIDKKLRPESFEDDRERFRKIFYS
jgi:hypothetical protein